MEAPRAAKPWHPGVLLEGTSSVQDVLQTISFVRGSPGYANIGAKLETRNCTTVDDLAEYSSVEFCALAKGCEIKRKARVYQAAIEAAIQRRLPAENAIKAELGSTKVKTETSPRRSDQRPWSSVAVGAAISAHIAGTPRGLLASDD